MAAPIDVQITVLDTLQGNTNAPRIAPRWKRYEWGKATTMHTGTGAWKHVTPGTGFYKIKEKGNDIWWTMDDVSRVVGGEGYTSHQNSWRGTSQESLERIKLMFRMLGWDEHLQLCENPELMKVDDDYDGPPVDALDERKSYNVQKEHLDSMKR